MSGAIWTAKQLVHIGKRQGLNLAVPRYNPRPAGVYRPGCTADAVLQFLHGFPKNWFTHGEIVKRTGCSSKAVTWACIYLRSLHLVECTSDDARNPRYLRYRIHPNPKD